MLNLNLGIYDTHCYMTTKEKIMANRLQKCTFLPGSFEKKFVHGLANWQDRHMSSVGRAMLVQLFVKYRKQIPDFEEVCFELTKDRP